MLIQPTLDTLNQLKLHGMAVALSEQMSQTTAQSLPFEDRLGLLVERELTYRENRRLTRLLQLAQLKERAALEDLDFRARRGVWTVRNWRVSPAATGSVRTRIFSSMAQPGAARPFWAARSPIKLAVRVYPLCICAPRGCSMNSVFVMPTAAFADDWPPSPRSTSW